MSNNNDKYYNTIVKNHQELEKEHEKKEKERGFWEYFGYLIPFGAAGAVIGYVGGILLAVYFLYKYVWLIFIWPFIEIFIKAFSG